MTKKLWFQVSIGILLALLIIKYFMEIIGIFIPLVIIAKTIFVPLLLGGVLYYITEPIQRFLEKQKVPRWGSILSIFAILIGVIWTFVAIIGPPVTEQVNNLVENTPVIASEINGMKDYALQHKKDLPLKLQESIRQCSRFS